MSDGRLTISSNTLFHFTKKKENILGILKEGFKPHLCLENLNIVLSDEPTEELAEELEQAIPMICFCDIPLSQSKNHMNTYGHYGIGLNKKWGMNKKISPVLYAYQKSGIISVIEQMLVKLYKENNFNNDLWYNIYDIYCFTKEYEGKLWDKEKRKYSDKSIRFYDEREWRFIPPLEDLSNYCLHKHEFLDKSVCDEKNREIENMILDFKASDVKYIITAKEKQITTVVKKIERIKRYTQDEIKFLCSKVISAEQICEDF